MSQATPIDTDIKLLYKTGKVVLGSKRSIEAVKLGKAVGVIVANNIPKNLLEDVMYYAKLGNIKVIKYPGSSYDLGSVLGKPFPVTLVAVLEPGDSKILEVGEK
ncbi:MAG: 50S ribosomal protein L30e [Zestosphaera tikiterensis]|uniref:Large ribosomal subunit protein eL30 n=1 Tax=Zestosphaera tikiterensis TaxID=1973259 RepID=A0A2R7Y5J3_9CREN|nr:MAG: 50S ribosomal protein L30e [Zestosphaera tikiterensis]